MAAHIDAPFRIALGAILLAAFSVRIYGHWQTLQAGKIRWIEGKRSIALRIVAGLAGITVLWTYLIRPEGILWASVPLPELIRWFGVAAGAIGIWMLALVHRALGRNFAASLHVRTEGHRLVTSGPYRWVRNPMYTSIYIILFSFFLVSANWLIGLAWLAGYTALMISRVPKEETLMELPGTPENRPMRDASKPANGIEAGQKHLYPTADGGDKRKVHIRSWPILVGPGRRIRQRRDATGAPIQRPER